MTTKKYLVLLGFLLCSLVGYSQNRSELKGPKYKNYKAWNAAKTTLKAGSTEVPKLKGPAFKNRKPGDRKVISSYPKATAVRKKSLKGPKAKNYRRY